CRDRWSRCSVASGAPRGPGGRAAVSSRMRWAGRGAHWRVEPNTEGAESGSNPGLVTRWRADAATGQPLRKSPAVPVQPLACTECQPLRKTPSQGGFGAQTSVLQHTGPPPKTTALVEEAAPLGVPGHGPTSG